VPRGGLFPDDKSNSLPQLRLGIENSVYTNPWHLFDHTFDHHYYSELPANGSGMPNQLLGLLPHTIACSGLSRAGEAKLQKEQ